MPDSPPWEEVDHTADWALRVTGRSLPALFENAARGMMSLLGGEADPGVPYQRAIRLQAPDRVILLVDWLNELLYFIESDGILFTEINVRRLVDTTLEAEVRGGRGRHLRRHIKAATYHQLAIRDTPTGYETVIVFDV
jgi:SHS2 domain-containing protein